MNKWVKSYNFPGIAGATIKFNQHGDISAGGFTGFLVTGGKLVNKGPVV
jgi:hypothetical protein